MIELAYIFGIFIMFAFIIFTFKSKSLADRINDKNLKFKDTIIKKRRKKDSSDDDDDDSGFFDGGFDGGD